LLILMGTYAACRCCSVSLIVTCSGTESEGVVSHDRKCCPYPVCSWDWWTTLYILFLQLLLRSEAYHNSLFSDGEVLLTHTQISKT
jgi:hypothetical protein